MRNVTQPIAPTSVLFGLPTVGCPWLLEIGGGLGWSVVVIGLYKLMTQPFPKAMDNQPTHEYQQVNTYVGELS